MHGTQIRPARQDDEERIRRFLAGLSLHTQTLRFFTGLGSPPASLVRLLVALDEQRDAVVATIDGEIVGHAMSYRGDTAGAQAGEAGVRADVEIAVVVADEWQGRGLGPRLIDVLLFRAAVRGATTVGMDVLGENRRVLRMIRRLWPDARMTVASGSVAVTAMIQSAAVFAEQGSGAAPLTT